MIECESKYVQARMHPTRPLHMHENKEYGGVLVMERTLSPTKAAASYWWRELASRRHVLSFSIKAISFEDAIFSTTLSPLIY
jgi:hypothetical protein